MQRDIVVIGASAGGIEALEQIMRRLPAELPAAVFVVLHLSASGSSVLPAILTRAGRLPAESATGDAPIERGRVYVAPPDHHMLVRADRVEITRGPRENGHRPAIDPLFRSAARAHGKRVVGVVLSGALDDGTDGLRFIAARGGATVVQDPDDARVASMPESALAITDADRVEPAERLAEAICDLLDLPLPLAPEELSTADIEPDQVELPPNDPRSRRGSLSSLTCPDCGGALWEHEEGGHLRFSCHVGHAFSPKSLASEQAGALETALWAALRSLDERSDLFRRMARRQPGGGGAAKRRLEARAQTVQKHAAVVREAIEQLGVSEGEPAAAEAAE